MRRTLDSLPWLIEIISFLASVLRQSADGALTRRPADTFSLVGQRTILRCSTNLDEPLYWARRLHGSDDIDVIFQADTLVDRHKGRLEVRKEEVGAFDLHIVNTTLAEAGNYYCVDDDNAFKPDGQDKQHIELTVLDNFECTDNITKAGMIVGPLCDIPFPPDVVRISCSVKFNGRTTPVISLQHRLHPNYSNSSSASQPDVVKATEGNKHMASLMLSVDQSFRQSHFTAEVQITGGNRGWKSTEIKLLYMNSPQSQSATNSTIPVVEVCKVDHNINIALESYAVSYHWVNNDNGLLFKSNHLQVLENHRNLTGVYSCVVTCNILGRHSELIIKNVNVIGDSSDSEQNFQLGTMAMLMCVILCGFLIILLIIWVCLRIRRRRASAKASYAFGETMLHKITIADKAQQTPLTTTVDKNQQTSELCLVQPDKIFISSTESVLICISLHYQDHEIQPCVCRINLKESDTVTITSTLPFIVHPNSSSCVVANDFYVIGVGRGRNEFWRWSGSHRKWTKLPDMPSGRCRHSVVCINRQIFVIGGLIFSEIDAIEREWLEIERARRDIDYKQRHFNNGISPESIPTSRRPFRWHSFYHGARHSMRDAPFKNINRTRSLIKEAEEIDDECRPTNEILCYDVDKNKWEYSGSLLYGVRDAACVVCKNEIFIFGGFCNNKRESSKIQVYNINSGQIIESDLPQVSGIFSVAMFKSNAILINNHMCYIYDLDKMKMREDDRFKSKRHEASLCMDNSRLYLVGGWKYDSNYERKIAEKVKVIEIADIVSEKNFDSWKDHCTLPYPGEVYCASPESIVI